MFRKRVCIIFFRCLGVIGSCVTALRALCSRVRDGACARKNMLYGPMGPCTHMAEKEGGFFGLGFRVWGLGFRV